MRVLFLAMRQHRPCFSSTNVLVMHVLFFNNDASFLTIINVDIVFRVRMFS
ncbi:hypothetical protein QKQ66_gp009 [Dione juno nucleopolyhedrovirus]|uniref:Uncharacterized protein n=1 Tax=Dione juno nucleopolyhedrovirus TaxID=2594175 RepID=A0AAE6H2W0_9ABAC|nr:hypothetical protein QKQ66_gp009 [Dione juno nucleopolyhedrovirus]QDL56933.1 hypothetical protein DijuNPV-ORF-9 [Dione juno nucleopolyhedrovirus]